MDDRATEPTPKRSLGRILLIGFGIFVLLIVVLAVLAWTVGDTLLPMQYEGFD